MTQHLAAIALVVAEYDEALAFYVGKLGFVLVEDTRLSDTKRWLLVAPPGSREARLLLAKADSPEQKTRIGNQTGGRVFLFLHTDDFARDDAAMRDRGVRFLELPRHEAYGTVAGVRRSLRQQVGPDPASAAALNRLLPAVVGEKSLLTMSDRGGAYRRTFSFG